MATHFMRILSRMMVPGPARTPSRPDVRGGRAAAVREYSGATPSPPSTHSHTPDIATLRCRGTSVICP